MIEAGMVTSEQVDNSLKTLLPQLQQQSILGAFNRTLNGGTEQEVRDYMEKFQKTDFPDMNFIQKGETLAKLVGMEAIHQQSLLSRQSVTRSTLEDMVNQTQRGGFVDPQLAAELPVTDAKLAAEFAPKLEKARVYNTVMTALRYLPPNERKTAMQAAVQLVISDIAITEPKQFVSSLERGDEDQQKKFQDDPFAYVENHPAVLDAKSAKEISQMARAQLFGSGDGLRLPQPNPALLDATLALNTDPLQTSLNLQKSLGATNEELRVMSKTTAANEATIIADESMKDQIDAVRDFASSFPGHENIAMRDLNKAGLSFATQPILAASQNTASRALVPHMLASEAQTASERKETQIIAINKTGVPLTEVETDINTAFKDYTADPSVPSQTQLNIFTQAKTLAFYLMGIKGKSEKDAVKNATDAIVNNNFDFVSQHGNPPLRVAKGQNANDIARAVSALINIAEGKQLEIPAFIRDKNQGASERELQEIYRDTIINDGYGQANPATDGLWLVGPEGVPVFDENGNHIEASYIEIKSPDSDVNRFMTTESIPARLINSVVGRFLVPRGGITRRAARVIIPEIKEEAAPLIAFQNIAADFLTQGSLTKETKKQLRALTVRAQDRVEFVNDILQRVVIPAPAKALSFIVHLPRGVFNETKKQVDNFVANIPPGTSAQIEEEFKKLQTQLNKRKT